MINLLIFKKKIVRGGVGMEGGGLLGVCGRPRFCIKKILPYNFIVGFSTETLTFTKATGRQNFLLYYSSTAVLEHFHIGLLLLRRINQNETKLRVCFSRVCVCVCVCVCVRARD